MSNVGFGIGAAVGIASEVTEGTGVSPSVSLPFTQESLKAQRPVVKTGTITGDRSNSKMLDGVRSGQGDINMEIDGSNVGLMTYYANGKASGALTSSTQGGMITSTPTGSAEAGGSLAAGAYRYKVASIWERTDTGELFVCIATAEVTVTTASSNLTARVNFTDPTTLTSAIPSGFTYWGTAIYRTTIAGSTNTQKFLAAVEGTAATYDDDGSVTLGTKVPVTGVTYKKHIFRKAFVTGAHPLQAFTTTVNKDNDKAIQFLLCRCNTAEYVIGENGTVITAKFGVLARDWRTVSNFSPSVTNLRKMMSWGVTVRIDDTFDQTVRGATFTINNNGALRPGLSGLARMLDVGYGMRDISGSLPRSYNDQDFMEKLYNAERFAIDAWALGQGIVETDSVIDVDGAGTLARPLAYMVHFEVPAAAINDAGANAGGPGEMVEAINWMAEVDPTTGDDLIITVYNLTSSYA